MRALRPAGRSRRSSASTRAFSSSTRTTSPTASSTPSARPRRRLQLRRRTGCSRSRRSSTCSASGSRRSSRRGAPGWAPRSCAAPASRCRAEMVRQLRFGRALDNRRMKATGFRYRYTTRETVAKLREHQRLAPLMRAAGEGYRYERELEEFLRYSPSVRAANAAPQPAAQRRRRRQDAAEAAGGGAVRPQAAWREACRPAPLLAAPWRPGAAAARLRRPRGRGDHRAAARPRRPGICGACASTRRRRRSRSRCSGRSTACWRARVRPPELSRRRSASPLAALFRGAPRAYTRHGERIPLLSCETGCSSPLRPCWSCCSPARRASTPTTERAATRSPRASASRAWTSAGSTPRRRVPELERRYLARLRRPIVVHHDQQDVPA